MKIKLCGLSRKEDIIYANELLPDLVGFVFAKSQRQIDDAKAAKLRAALNPQISAVGVFVQEEISRMVELVEKGIIQWIQLHGNEDESMIRELKRKVDVPIIRAVFSSELVKMQNSVVEKYKNSEADYLLFDQGLGGSGITFDWNLIPEEWKKPYFLAGGINNTNIEKVKKEIQPFAVDVSSGVEVDGHKDYEKIKDMIRRLRDE